MRSIELDQMEETALIYGTTCATPFWSSTKNLINLGSENQQARLADDVQMIEQQLSSLLICAVNIRRLTWSWPIFPLGSGLVIISGYVTIHCWLKCDGILFYAILTGALGRGNQRVFPLQVKDTCMVTRNLTSFSLHLLGDTANENVSIGLSFTFRTTSDASE